MTVSALCVNPDHMEPVTHAENVRRGRLAKLTMAIAVEVREDFKAWHGSNTQFCRLWASRLDVTPGTIDHIINGRNWKSS